VISLYQNRKNIGKFSFDISCQNFIPKNTTIYWNVKIVGLYTFKMAIYHDISIPFQNHYKKIFIFSHIYSLEGKIYLDILIVILSNGSSYTSFLRFL